MEKYLIDNRQLELLNMTNDNEKINTSTFPNFNHVSGVHCTSSAIRDVLITKKISDFKLC